METLIGESHVANCPVPNCLTFLKSKIKNKKKRTESFLIVLTFFVFFSFNHRDVSELGVVQNA